MKLKTPQFMHSASTLHLIEQVGKTNNVPEMRV
jgi:hypothetical protein